MICRIDLYMATYGEKYLDAGYTKIWDDTDRVIAHMKKHLDACYVKVIFLAILLCSGSPTIDSRLFNPACCSHLFFQFCDIQ